MTSLVVDRQFQIVTLLMKRKRKRKRSMSMSIDVSYDSGGEEDYVAAVKGVKKGRVNGERCDVLPR